MSTDGRSAENDDTDDPPAYIEAFRSDTGGTIVTVEPESDPIDPRKDVIEYAGGGLEWGYTGDRALQTAVAILSHVFDAEYARKYHLEFTRHFVASLPNEGWAKTTAAIREFCIDRYGEPGGD